MSALRCLRTISHKGRRRTAADTLGSFDTPSLNSGEFGKQGLAARGIQLRYGTYKVAHHPYSPAASRLISILSHFSFPQLLSLSIPDSRYGQQSISMPPFDRRNRTRPRSGDPPPDGASLCFAATPRNPVRPLYEPSTARQSGRLISNAMSKMLSPRRAHLVPTSLPPTR